MRYCHHHLASREDRIARQRIEEDAEIVDPREAEQVGVASCARPLDRSTARPWRWCAGPCLRRSK
jgi:hypothetical protein